MLPCLPRLFLLLVACVALAEPRTHKGVTARRRHERHYARNAHRYAGRRIDREIKVFQDKNVEDVEWEKSGVGSLNDKQQPDNPEVPYDGEEAGVEKPPEYPWLKASQFPCFSAACDVDMEISKMIRIMQIKEQILKETGLKSPPNMTGVVISKTPVLQELISSLNRQNQDAKLTNDIMQKDTYGDDPNIRKEKMFIPSTKGPESVRIPEGKNLHFFNLSSGHFSNIAEANLHIWLKPFPNYVPKDKDAQITFYKVELPKFPSDYNRLRIINNKVTVPYNASGTWAKVDLFSLVREWLTNHSMNLGFVVTVKIDRMEFNIDAAEEDPAHAPLLELDVKEERNDRRKRFVNNRICSEGRRIKECCRYPLIVDFTKYEFDFIVAPKKYVANYCKGECNFLYAHKFPHSTILQQMFPNTSSYHHGPCCGASDLSPLTMVYYDGHKVKIEVIQNMVVNQCSCA